MMEAKPPQSLLLQEEATNEKTAGARLEKLAKNSPYLARLVASNPSAPAELLRLLAFSGDAPTQKNVAANPNTPTEVLLHLGAAFPEELLANPVFSLLLLENPRLLQEMPPATLASLVQLETVPVFFFEPAANRDDPEVLLALANNPKTPLAILKRLADSRDKRIGQVARLHVSLAGEMTEGWEQAARKEFWEIDYPDEVTLFTFLMLGVWPENKGVEILAEIDAIPHFGFFSSLPENPLSLAVMDSNLNTPASVLEQLAKDSDSQVLKEVAKNLNTPVSVLEQLAKNSNSEVRWNVASNANTPLSLVMLLAKDSDWGVRAGAASNASAPVSLLVQLAEDSDSGVRWSVAKNPNAPVSLVMLLAKDSDSGVRAGAASNASAPVSLLVQLAEDSDSGVRRKVAKNASTPVSLLVQLAKDSDFEVRREVASNPNTPVSLFEELATDSDVTVRWKVAKNLNTPVSVLEALAKDMNWWVRQCLAFNPNTPLSVLELLLGDPEKRILQIAVGRYLAKNPDGLSVVLQHYPKDSTPDWNSLEFSRLFILLHPQVPTNLLAKNCRSLWWWERYAVAQHPNTPPDTLKTLAGDPNRLVRAAARANLQNRQIEA